MIENLKTETGDMLSLEVGPDHEVLVSLFSCITLLHPFLDVISLNAWLFVPRNRVTKYVRAFYVRAVILLYDRNPDKMI